MEAKDLIIRAIEGIPEQYLPEILDFVRFLEARAVAEGIGTALATEAVLKTDWLRPEEDEAWQHL